MSSTIYTTFAGFRRVVTGDLKTVLLQTKAFLDGKDATHDEQVLIFDHTTGQQVDFDFRGTPEEVVARAVPEPPKPGRGRPRLGVTSGEVTLLPRHWEWLAAQPARASGTIRRLVEQASRSEAGDTRRKVEALGTLLWAIAGNLEGFEEASRAMYARNWPRFLDLVAPWPPDLRDHVRTLVEEIRPPEPAPTPSAAAALRDLDCGASPAPDTAPWRLGAVELGDRIARGEMKASAVVEAFLARIHEANPRLNALVEVWEDEARSAAADVDARRSRGETLGPLAGVPFTVKANLDVADRATTHGIPALRDAVPPLDCPLVRRLRAAGAIPLGHTNLPDLSLRFHTHSQLYGATTNPWNPAMSPGGSSGGEGVAVGTGMSPLGLGNDAGGSVRIPALFGGVAALKPTAGRFPSDRTAGPRDATLASQLIPVDGILARSVADLYRAFQIVAGPDPRDPRAVPAALWGPPPRRPIKVAVAADPGKRGVHPDVAASVERAAETLAHEGYAVERLDVPRFEEILEAYGRMIMTEFSLAQSMLNRLLGADGRKYIEYSTALRKPVDLAGYLELTARRQGFRREWAGFLDEHPLLLGPVFTEPAVAADQDIAGLEEHRRIVDAMALCSVTSFVGVPAVAVPTGMAGGLPQGVQLIGSFFREDLCLEAAAVLERRLGRIGPVEPSPAP